MKRSVVVAMSGGVDSSASALILSRAGYDVVGVSMQVWDYRNLGGNASRATCCAPSDFDDARRVAELGGFPFYVFDFEDGFKESVIDPFVNSYLKGETPNPCLDCNRKVKFSQLRRRAKAMGIDTVATGHYAQIKTNPSGLLGLYTGKDMAKDQSYFLYALTQDELSKTLFPVGGMLKPDVRKLLAEAKIESSSKPESQDICFVTGTVSSFVERNAQSKIISGNLVNTSGDVVGSHSGIHNFTVGQRKGIGGGNSNPLYVINIDANSGNVFVGEKDELRVSGFAVRNASYVSGNLPEVGSEYLVKLRYRQEGVRCRVDEVEGNTLRMSFVDDWTSVSPGQAAVLYSLALDSEGDREVIGGGIIAGKI